MLPVPFQNNVGMTSDVVWCFGTLRGWQQGLPSPGASSPVAPCPGESARLWGPWGSLQCGVHQHPTPGSRPTPATAKDNQAPFWAHPCCCRPSTRPGGGFLCCHADQGFGEPEERHQSIPAYTSVIRELLITAAVPRHRLSRANCGHAQPLV